MKKLFSFLLIILTIIVLTGCDNSKENFNINQFSKNIIGKEYLVDTCYNDTLNDGSTAKGTVKWKIKFVDSDKVNISFNHKYEWYIFKENSDLKLGTSDTEEGSIEQLNLEYKLKENDDKVKVELYYGGVLLSEDNKLKLKNDQWNTSFPIIETYFDIKNEKLNAYEKDTNCTDQKLTDEQFTKAYNYAIEKAKKQELADKTKKLYDISSKPYIGMNESSVISSKWGEPKYKNVTVTPYGKVEQWVYNGDRYVYLENGIVTGVQYSE